MSCLLTAPFEDGSIQGGRRLGDERDTTEAKDWLGNEDSCTWSGSVFPFLGCNEGCLRLVVLAML